MLGVIAVGNPYHLRARVYACVCVCVRARARVCVRMSRYMYVYGCVRVSLSMVTLLCIVFSTVLMILSLEWAIFGPPIVP